MLNPYLDLLKSFGLCFSQYNTKHEGDYKLVERAISPAERTQHNVSLALQSPLWQPGSAYCPLLGAPNADIQASPVYDLKTCIPVMSFIDCTG